MAEDRTEQGTVEFVQTKTQRYGNGKAVSTQSELVRTYSIRTYIHNTLIRTSGTVAEHYPPFGEVMLHMVT